MKPTLILYNNRYYSIRQLCLLKQIDRQRFIRHWEKAGYPPEVDDDFLNLPPSPVAVTTYLNGNLKSIIQIAKVMNCTERKVRTLVGKYGKLLTRKMFKEPTRVEAKSQKQYGQVGTTAKEREKLAKIPGLTKWEEELYPKH